MHLVYYQTNCNIQKIAHQVLHKPTKNMLLIFVANNTYKLLSATLLVVLVQKLT